MAEESGKGIALVILGIVAIIAIVGLVLLFTGARKAAVGEFAVPSAKEYGGAVRGVQDPYSRAFSGRAMDFPSGDVGTFAAQSQGTAGVFQGGVAHGDYAGNRAVQSADTVTYDRALTEVPSKAACQFMAQRSNEPQYTEPTDAKEYAIYQSMGRDCKAVTDLASEADRVAPDAYGRTHDVVDYSQSIGVTHCCEAARIGGTV